MNGPRKRAPTAVELQRIADGNTLYGMPPRSFFLTGVSVLFVIEGAFLWNFFISPTNYLLRITLILLTIACVVCLFLRRFQKQRLCLVGFACLGALFLAIPVAWDDRIASIRYGLQVDYFPKSLGIVDSTISVDLPSGEGTIERDHVTGQPLFVYKEFDDQSCYLQMTNISSNFLFRYGMCPSAISGLLIHKNILRFW